MAEIVNLAEYRKKSTQIALLESLTAAKQFSLQCGNSAAVGFLEAAMAHAMIGDLKTCNELVKSAEICLINRI